MKGNEGVQSQNEENQRSQAQKLENRLGYGADKFFVWDLGKTDRFWQLVGGAHGEGRHKKKCYLTWTTPMEGHLARSKS